MASRTRVPLLPLLTLPLLRPPNFGRRPEASHYYYHGARGWLGVDYKLDEVRETALSTMRAHLQAANGSVAGGGLRHEDAALDLPGPMRGLPCLTQSDMTASSYEYEYEQSDAAAPASSPPASSPASSAASTSATVVAPPSSHG